MNNPKTINGYLYVMSNSSGHVKIGHSINPKDRLVQIKCGDPSVKIEFISQPVSNRVEVEKMCHAKIKDFSIGGEWFSCGVPLATEVIDESINDIGQSSIDEDDSEFECRLAEARMMACGYLLKSISSSYEGKSAIFSYMELIVKSGSECHLKAFREKEGFEQYLEASNYFSKRFILQLKLEG